jgi:hypothetical protein
MADELMFDFESGDEGECDWGLYRAAENCPGGAAKYFEMPSDSRQEYRQYDRARAHHTRRHQQQQQQQQEERGDEMEWAEEAGVPQQQAETEEGEVDYDPGPPSPPPQPEPQPQPEHAQEAHDDDDTVVPVKADGSYDRQAIWQRYRRISRRQLQEGGQSVKASAVNELARSLYREDGW